MTKCIRTYTSEGVTFLLSLNRTKVGVTKHIITVHTVHTVNSSSVTSRSGDCFSSVELILLNCNFLELCASIFNYSSRAINHSPMLYLI